MTASADPVVIDGDDPPLGDGPLAHSVAGDRSCLAATQASITVISLTGAPAPRRRRFGYRALRPLLGRPCASTTASRWRQGVCSRRLTPVPEPCLGERRGCRCVARRRSIANGSSQHSWRRVRWPYRAPRHQEHLPEPTTVAVGFRVSFGAVSLNLDYRIWRITR